MGGRSGGFADDNEASLLAETAGSGLTASAMAAAVGRGVFWLGGFELDASAAPDLHFRRRQKGNQDSFPCAELACGDGGTGRYHQHEAPGTTRG